MQTSERQSIFRTSFPLLVLLVVIAAALAAYGPILTPEGYFDFVDKRVIFGIPHFGDVVSNAPFLPVGLLGVYLTRRYAAAGSVNPAYRAALVGLFLSVAAVAFGSGYFHLAPDGWRISVDRLPIAIAAGCLFSALAIERLNLSDRQGHVLLLVAIVFNLLAVWISHKTGDLRLYLFSQFAPILGGILLVAIFKVERPGITAGRVLLMIGLYGAAKITEVFDQEIYDALTFVSGHNLKHLFAAAAAACAIPRHQV
jgi:peptidoglycan/LPS O-acetylase OafA/YrhL